MLYQLLFCILTDIKKEKLKNSSADVGTTLFGGIGSLFGSNKTKQQQQEIEALKADNPKESRQHKKTNN